MRILNRMQSKILDQRMKSDLDLSDELLVEAVGAQSSLHIQRVLLQKSGLKKFLPVTIVTGPGHNGLDGMVIARHLNAMGIPCEVFSASSKSALLKKEKDRLNFLGIPIHPLEKLRSVKAKRVFVDALFGVGVNRDLDESLQRCVRHLNRHSQFTFSVDIPSGLDADTGNRFGETVRASVTLAIGFLKPAFFSADGPEFCGTLHLVSAGFDRKILADVKPVMKVVLPEALSEFLPQTSRRFHKGSTGKCHLVVGSSRYLGAALLVARGALASGGTFIVSHGDSSLREILKDLPEIIFQPGYEIDWIDQLTPKDVVVLGSGAPDLESLKNIIEVLMRKNHSKVLLDADALKVIKRSRLKVPETWVLTPHPGEMAELLGRSVKEVEGNRSAAASETQEKWGGRVLLKGYQPVLATCGDEIWFLPYGDERLGKAGNGDILSGVIGGLWSQIEDGVQAVSLAVFLQAQASRILSEGRGPRSLLPSEIPAAIGQAIKGLIAKKTTKFDHNWMI